MMSKRTSLKSECVMGVVFGSCLLVTAQQREFDNARNTLIADQFNNPVIEVDHKAPGLPAPDGAQRRSRTDPHKYQSFFQSFLQSFLRLTKFPRRN